MKVLTLREYEEQVVNLTDREFASLEAAAGTKLQLSGRPDRRVALKATQHVGTIVAADVHVRIRPKIPLTNLFHLLGISGSAVAFGDLDAIYDDASDDLIAAVIAMFVRGVERLSGQGLAHGYVPFNEDVVAIRGRIDIRQAALRGWQPLPVRCDFDEHVPDIWVNQVLKAALLRVRSFPALPPVVRAEIHRLLSRFEGVRFIDVDRRRLRNWKAGRLEHRYTGVIALARIVLERLSLADAEGGHRAASFTVDMNQVFEDFVTRSLDLRLGQLVGVEAQHTTTLDTGGKLGIRPDIVLRDLRTKQIVGVADAKYKLTESKGSLGDHQQLVAYTTVLGLAEGVLIYCGEANEGDDLPVAPFEIRGAHSTNWVYRLDLRGDLADIERAADELAAWIHTRLEPTFAAPPIPLRTWPRIFGQRHNIIHDSTGARRLLSNGV